MGEWVCHHAHAKFQIKVTGSRLRLEMAAAEVILVVLFLLPRWSLLDFDLQTCLMLRSKARHVLTCLVYGEGICITRIVALSTTGTTLVTYHNSPQWVNGTILCKLAPQDQSI